MRQVHDDSEQRSLAKLDTTNPLAHGLILTDGACYHSSKIPEAAWFGPWAKEDGWYIFYGMWKGPFPSKIEAKAAYAEWVFEAKYS